YFVPPNDLHAPQFVNLNPVFALYLCKERGCSLEFVCDTGYSRIPASACFWKTPGFPITQWSSIGDSASTTHKDKFTCVSATLLSPVQPQSLLPSAAPPSLLPRKALRCPPNPAPLIPLQPCLRRSPTQVLSTMARATIRTPSSPARISSAPPRTSTTSQIGLRAFTLCPSLHRSVPSLD